MRTLFVDDRLDEVQSLWKNSGSTNNHVLLPLEPFLSIGRTCELVIKYRPEIIFIGFGLGIPHTNGAGVIRALREQGYNGEIIGNSGGGGEQFERAGIKITHINRNPQLLKELWTTLT